MTNEQAVAANAAKTAIGRVLAADGGVALQIRYVGSPESSPDYADAVLVSATSLTLSVNGVADSTVGATGVLAFATYTTLGALVDAINLSDNWEARIVAGLRSDAVNGSELLARSTSTFRPYQAIDLFFDSSDNGVLGIDFVLEPGLEDFARPTQEKLRRVAFKRLQAYVNTSAGQSIQIYVYEVGPDRAAVLETLAQYQVDDDTPFDSNDVATAVANAKYGNSILVRFRGTGWVDAAAYLRVFGERE